MKYTTPYTPPTLTVDAVIFQIIDEVLHVALLQRSNDPFKGAWALPGGYGPEGETTIEALKRVVKYKAGIDLNTQLSYIEQLYTFDTVARDPRGHAVSVTYMGGGRGITPTDAHELVSFFPVNQLPPLAYDHATIIEYARERLIAKLTYTNAVYAFVPSKFTLTEIQRAYEAVFDHPLDKRNFRKKFLSLDLVHETDEMKRDGAHRPARLYVFNSTSIDTLTRTFD